MVLRLVPLRRRAPQAADVANSARRPAMIATMFVTGIRSTARMPSTMPYSRAVKPKRMAQRQAKLAKLASRMNVRRGLSSAECTIPARLASQPTPATSSTA